MDAGTQTDETRSQSLKERHFDEELLPGIPNDITLNRIAPKLAWRALPVLSRVSRCWEEAIRTKRVYDARVRANSAEAMIVHGHRHDHRVDLALYSTSEKCCFELPQLPSLPGGTLHSYQCVAGGGKLYVLGGMQTVNGSRLGHVLKGVEYIPRAEVYVLDLGGVRGKWERCASMLEPRYEFGCGVMDGKIYVFGGSRDANPGKDNSRYRCEVYDIENNAWSPMMPTIHKSDYKHADAGVGNGLFLHYNNHSAWGVYNPGNNEWRLVERLLESEIDRHNVCPWSPLYTVRFTANEKYYLLSRSGIDVYDAERNSWINRHCNSFVAVLPDIDDPPRLFPLDVLAVKDELVLTAACFIGWNRHVHSFQCIGFDREKKEIVWEKTDCSFSHNILDFLHCSIQL